MNRPAPRSLRPARRLAGLGRAVGSGALLLALLAGMPYALARYGSWLLPDRMPRPHDLWITLQSPPSTPLLLELLVLAGWAIWTVLLLNTAAEATWWLRHLPALLRGTDAHALAARRGITGVLVATLVLGLLAAAHDTRTPAPAVIGATGTAAYPLASISAPQVPTPQFQAPAVPQQAECTVEHGDTLWDLARRHLGNPLRWQEIYHLNHGRQQPDGHRLDNPDRIYPGWRLLLPAEDPATVPTATTPSISPPSTTAPAPGRAAPLTSPLPTALSPASAQHLEPGVPYPHSPVAAVSGAAGHEHGVHRHHGTELPGGAGYIDLATLAALSAAATLLVRRRRTTPYTPTTPRPLTAPQPAGPEHNPLLDGMRRLAREQREHDTNTVVDPRTPTPVALGATQDGPLTLAEVLDRSSGGQFALTGPGAVDAVRALFTSALTAATTSPGERLVLTAADIEHLAPALTGADLPGVTIADTTDAALQQLEDHALDHVQHAAASAGSGVRLVLVTSELDRRQRHRLDRLLRTATGQLGAVHLGPTPEADTYEVAPDGTTRNHSCQPGDAPLPRFFHLHLQSADILLRVIRSAHETTPKVNPSDFTEDSPELSPPERQAASKNSSDDSFQPQEEIPPGPVPLSEAGPARTSAQPPGNCSGTVTMIVPVTAAATEPVPVRDMQADVPLDKTPSQRTRPVRLTLLGGAALRLHDGPARELTGSVGELLAFLAVHDTGASTDLIATSLWPTHATTAERAQVKFDNTKAYARRTLRETLGAASAILFLQTPSGWRLDPQLIDSDLADLRSALRDAHRASTAPARLEACRRATALDTGQLLGASDAEWLDLHREDLRRRLLDCLDTLASTPGQAPDETLQYLAHAARLDPCNEHLHLRQARLLASLGRTDAVLRTQGILKQHLAEIDERPTPAITAEFRRLLDPAARPGLAPARPSTPAAHTRR